MFAIVCCPHSIGFEKDKIALVDLDPSSETYCTILSEIRLTSNGDEPGRMNWAKSAGTLTEMSSLVRRNLIIPCMNSGKIYIVAYENQRFKIEKVRKKARRSLLHPHPDRKFEAKTSSGRMFRVPTQSDPSHSKEPRSTFRLWETGMDMAKVCSVSPPLCSHSLFPVPWVLLCRWFHSNRQTYLGSSSEEQAGIRELRWRLQPSATPQPDDFLWMGSSETLPRRLLSQWTWERYPLIIP